MTPTMTATLPPTMTAANDPARVAAFVDLFNSHPCPALIANLSTRVEMLTLAGHAFPLTVNDGSPTCYLCSPTTAYLDYALEETRTLAFRPLLRRAVGGLIRLCRPLVRATGLDRQVQVNNWLFSTNPLPRLDRPAVAALRTALLARHPGHAIVIRSLNRLADGPSLAALQAEGFRLLPARQVYVLQTGAQDRPTKTAREDRRKLAATPLQQVGNDGFTTADYARCAELYAALYLHKYTPLNPAYTALWVAQMHRRGLLHLQGLREPAGGLVAVTGYFQNGTTLTQPIVGYDTSRPMQQGLYRMVMELGRQHAAARGLVFNISAGAADFKRRRGAVAVIEYTAVHVAHLPLRQRLAVRLVELVLTRIGVPLMERFEL